MYDDNRQLVFYVSDTGIGIDKEKHDFIFGRFAQVEKGLSRLYGGTGLGLSIVKGLVELMGGKIWIESELGKGSTFYFTIALHQQQAEKDLPLEKETFVKNSILQKRTVLIVEDDIFNLRFIEEVLSDLGYSLLLAKNGVDAVDIATTKKPDLILMDIGLPDISGYDAVKQILSVQPEMKIIAQTAFASLDDKIKALNAGCVDFISKPLRANLLTSIIKKYL
jgi:CheY-like chemotaxis protein